MPKNQLIIFERSTEGYTFRFLGIPQTEVFSKRHYQKRTTAFTSDPGEFKNLIKSYRKSDVIAAITKREAERKNDIDLDLNIPFFLSRAAMRRLEGW